MRDTHPEDNRFAVFPISGNTKRILIKFAILAIALAACVRSFAGSFVVTNHWQRNVHPGVVYHHYRAEVGGKPVHIHVAVIDLNRGNLRVQPVMGWDRMDRLETVTSMTRRHSPIVAINGSYFNRDPSDAFPVGFLMIDGRVVYFSHTHRSAFGLTRDNIPLFGYPRTRGSIYAEDSGE